MSEGEEQSRFVSTKVGCFLSPLQLMELSLSSSGQITRLPSLDALISSVRGIQQFAAVRAGASKAKFFDKSSRGEEVSLDLCTPGSDVPRYSLYIVDREKRDALKFGIFIVPQGR